MRLNVFIGPFGFFREGVEVVECAAFQRLNILKLGKTGSHLVSGRNAFTIPYPFAENHGITREQQTREGKNKAT